MQPKTPSKPPVSEPATKKKENRGGKRVSYKPICGGISRSTGKPCPRVAGWGTDHKGSGRCRTHGGNNKIKHGLYSKVIPADYQETYQDLLKAPHPNSLMDELAYLRTVLMRLEKKHGTNEDGSEKGAVMIGETMVEPLQMISDCIEQISRVAKRKHDMEEGQKITFSLTDLTDFSEAIMQAIVKHVSNPDTLTAIRGELAAIFTGQASPAGA
ncbi:MAG: hypothetical protein Q7U76_12805 [Nitrospirota bacterium]|nr:hypothetical protein [Nitrospirota bacterium]